LSWEFRSPIENRHPSIPVARSRTRRLSCRSARLRIHRGRLRCVESRASRPGLARSRGAGLGGAFPLPPVSAPRLVPRGQSFGRRSQCIMRERPASEGRSRMRRCLRSAALCRAPLRYGGAGRDGNGSGAGEPQKRIGRLAGEWHFTLRERCSWRRMTFPSRRQLG
jgi:hypothetical protein